MIFGSIILIDDERRDFWEPLFDGLPAIVEAINDEIASDLGLRKIEKEFLCDRQINAIGGDFLGLFVLKIVIETFDHDATQATARKTFEQNRGFGIAGEAQHRLVSIRRLI